MNDVLEVDSFHYLWDLSMLTRNGLLILLSNFLPHMAQIALSNQRTGLDDVDDSHLYASGASVENDLKILTSSCIASVMLLWTVAHVAYRPYGRARNDIFSLATCLNMLELFNLLLMTALVVFFPAMSLKGQEAYDDRVSNASNLQWGSTTNSFSAGLTWTILIWFFILFFM